MDDILDRFIKKVKPEENPEPENPAPKDVPIPGETFKNLLEAHRWLEAQGYKIKKSAVYNAAKRGEIKVNPDRSVAKIAIQAYAAGLQKTGGQEELLETAERKARAELQKTLEQTKNIVFDRKIKEGKYILKEEAILNRVDQLLILDAGFRNLIDRNIYKWVSLVGGDPSRINDTKRIIHIDVDDLFNSLAGSDSFMVEE